MPMPPIAVGVALPWDAAVADAVGEIAAARDAHGDTFVIDSGRERYLFTFSAAGVESFYALPEEVASKGVADYLMLRRKLPDEIFDGRRTLPGTLFRRDDVVSYLRNLEDALDVTVDELGESGTVDLFALTRRLGHRMGLASWAAPGAAHGDRFERLVAAFDILDGSDAFVHPDAMAAVAASGKAAETAALAEAADEIGSAVPDGGLFGRIADAWAQRARRRAAARYRAGRGPDPRGVDVEPARRTRLGHGGPGRASRRARLSRRRRRGAGRALRARVDSAGPALDHGAHGAAAPDVRHRRRRRYDVPPGWTIATLLPLLNTTAAPELADLGARAAGSGIGWPTRSMLASSQLVTAFGHGRHSCPAQPFSLAAMTAAMTRLGTTFDLVPAWSEAPVPVPAQIGGVARAARPCLVSYRRR